MKNESFALEIERFWEYFKSELKLTNKSKHTIISYNTTIKSFIKFIRQYEKTLSFENMKKMDVMNFLEYKNMMLEKQTELKMSSKKLYVIHLKTFFMFIEENLDIDIKISNIFKINIKTPSRTPKGVEQNDVLKIESFLDSMDISGEQNAKTSLMIKIMLYGGARRGEISNIRIDDFADEGEIYIIRTIGKGDKERVLYLPKEKTEKEIKILKTAGFDYIALTKTRKRMDGSQIYHLLNNTYKKIGVKYSGAHILRHTFAKSMIAKDVNIVTVKELLGHSNIQTTMIYVNPNEKEVQKAYLTAMNN